MGPIRRLIIVAFAGAVGAAGLVAMPAAWAGSGVAANGGIVAPASEWSAQQRAQDPQPRRQPRTRIRITKPRPLGPNAYRECASWYEEEFRRSGTVVVPKMRCWWVNP